MDYSRGAARAYVASLGWWGAAVIYGGLASVVGWVQYFVDAGTIGPIITGPVVIPAWVWILSGYVAIALGAFVPFRKMYEEAARVSDKEGREIVARYAEAYGAEVAPLLGEFAAVWAKLYSAYCSERGYSSEHWRNRANEAPFPSAESLDSRLADIAEVIIHRADLDAHGATWLYAYSPSWVKGALKKEQYVWLLDHGRGDIVRFIEKWDDATVGLQDARQRITKKLAAPSTVRILKVVYYLDRRLAIVLGNGDPIDNPPASWRLARTVCESVRP